MSGLEEGLTTLEHELAIARSWAARSLSELHSVMGADLERAQARVRRAKARAEVAERRMKDAQTRRRVAERRAVRAERELADLRSSATWRVGRAVVAVPARLKRLGTR